MQDSATATVRPASSPATCSSTVEPSSENSVSAWRVADELEQRVVVGLRRRLVARRDLDLAAAQAGGDLERRRAPGRPPRRPAACWRSRTRGSRTAGRSRAGRSVAPAIAAPERRRSARAISHIGCSSRGGPGSTTTVGPSPSRGRHDEPGRRADRLEHRRALRDHRLLAVGARGSRPDRGPASASSSAAGSRRSAPPARRRAPSRGRRSGPTTSAVRSSAVGPRPPLVTISAIPCSRHEAQRGEQVLGPVADDLDHRGVDADLAQPLGQPGAVAVGDDPGQHLGAGDQDPGARGRGCPREAARAGARSCAGRLLAAGSGRRRRRASSSVADRARPTARHGDRLRR